MAGGCRTALAEQIFRSRSTSFTWPMSSRCTFGWVASTGAVDVVRSRRGTQFSPAVAEVFERDAAAIVDGLLEMDVWTAALAQAPDRDRILDDDEIDELLRAIADFVDPEVSVFSGLLARCWQSGGRSSPTFADAAGGRHASVPCRPRAQAGQIRGTQSDLGKEGAAQHG